MSLFFFENEKTTFCCAVIYGVLQGSILGPLLFLVYINILSDAVKILEVSFYADDTV